MPDADTVLCSAYFHNKQTGSVDGVCFRGVYCTHGGALLDECGVDAVKIRICGKICSDSIRYVQPPAS